MYAANGRLIPFNSNSPTGSIFTARLRVLNPFSLAWRVVDCQYEHVVFTEIAERVLLARAYLANGATADWIGAAVNSVVARAAQDVSRWLHGSMCGTEWSPGPGKQARNCKLGCCVSQLRLPATIVGLSCKQIGNKTKAETRNAVKPLQLFCLKLPNIVTRF